MRVCIHKASGRILESQGNDEADLESLWENAKAAGFKKSEVTVRIIPDDEFERMLSEQIASDMGYAEKRRREYPAIGDQLDLIMKWLATETEVTVPDELKSMAMKCMSVKAKHPKE